MCNWIGKNPFEFAEVCDQEALDVDADATMVILAVASLLHVVDDKDGALEFLVVDWKLLLLQRMTLVMKMTSRDMQRKIRQMM
jgi:hypothetical protein